MNCNYQLGEWQRRKKLLSQIQRTSIFLMAQPPLTVQVQIEYRFYVFPITRFQHKFIFISTFIHSFDSFSAFNCVELDIF